MIFENLKKRFAESQIPYSRCSMDANPQNKDQEEETAFKGLTTEDSRRLAQIAKEDPEALVLFETQLPDGRVRRVDVFGRETVISHTGD